MGTVRNPDLHDCINYMKSQIKQMKKYPTSYEFNIPYYEKTVEYLETRGTTDGNCATCVKAVVIEDRPHGEWKDNKCTNCGEKAFPDVDSYGTADGYILTSWCPNCGADMRKEGDGT